VELYTPMLILREEVPILSKSGTFKVSQVGVSVPNLPHFQAICGVDFLRERYIHFDVLYPCLHHMSNASSPVPSTQQMCLSNLGLIRGCFVNIPS
jgi:hypothetical protein